LTAAAAEGRFALQVCADCAQIASPPRDACPRGVRVLNAFFGPLETEWFQTVLPPKLAPAALAKAVVTALKEGVEDIFVGDIAQDIRERLKSNPKALERELGSQ
jgi:hypothetical protein